MRRFPWLLAGVAVTVAAAGGAGLLIVPGRAEEAPERKTGQKVALSADAEQRLQQLQQRLHARLKHDEPLKSLGREVHGFVEAHGRSGAAHRLLGQLRMEQEKTEAALRHFERALSFDPAQPEIALVAGTLAFELTQYEKALRYYRRAGEGLAEDPRPPMHRAQVRLRQGRLEEAEKQARRALARDHNRHEPHVVLAAIARERDRLEGAVTHLQRALRRVPVSKAEQRTALTLRQARVLRQSGQAETALQVLRRLYGERGRRLDVLEARAACWADLDRPAKAAKAFERALGSEQANWRYLARAAKWRLRAGDREKARAHLQRLARVRPGAEVLQRLRQKLKQGGAAAESS